LASINYPDAKKYDVSTLNKIWYGAVVVRKQGYPLDQETVITFCASKLAGYKKPKRVEFAEDLPKNPSGKVTKNVLRDPFWAGRKKRI
jgi:acyl-coenzyme A synthetase/AMP-(fatty) acid ligase